MTLSTFDISHRLFFSSSSGCKKYTLNYPAVEQYTDCRNRRANRLSAFQFKLDLDLRSLGNPTSALSCSLQHLHKKVGDGGKSEIHQHQKVPLCRNDAPHSYPGPEVTSEDLAEAALVRFHECMLKFSTPCETHSSRSGDRRLVSSILVEAERAMQISVQNGRPKEALDVFWALNSTGLLPFSTRSSGLDTPPLKTEGETRVAFLARRLCFWAQHALQALPHRQLQAHLVDQLLEAEDTNAESPSSLLGVSVLKDSGEDNQGEMNTTRLKNSLLSSAEQFRRQLYREEQLIRSAKLLSSHFSQGFYLSKIRDVLHENPLSTLCSNVDVDAFEYERKGMNVSLKDSVEVFVLCRLSFAILWHPKTLLLLDSTVKEEENSRVVLQRRTSEDNGLTSLFPTSSVGGLPWSTLLWLPVPAREGLLQLYDQTAPVLEMCWHVKNNGLTISKGFPQDDTNCTEEKTFNSSIEVHKEESSATPNHRLFSLLTHLCAEWDGMLVRRVLNDILLPAAAHNIFISPPHFFPQRSVPCTQVNNVENWIPSPRSRIHNKALEPSAKNRSCSRRPERNGRYARPIELAASLSSTDLALSFSQYLFPSPESARNQFPGPSSLLPNPSPSHARLALLLSRRRFQYIIVPDADFILKQTRRLWELGKYREIVVTHSVLLELLHVAQGGGCVLNGWDLKGKEEASSIQERSPKEMQCWWEIAGFTQSASSTCSPKRFAARRVLCEIFSRTMRGPQDVKDKESCRKSERKSSRVSGGILWKRKKMLGKLSSLNRWKRESDAVTFPDDQNDDVTFSVPFVSSQPSRGMTMSERHRRKKRRQGQSQSEGPSTISFVDDRSQTTTSKAWVSQLPQGISKNTSRKDFRRVEKVNNSPNHMLSPSRASSEQQELLHRLDFFFPSKTSLGRRGALQPNTGTRILRRVSRFSTSGLSPLAPSGGVTILGMLDELALLHYVDQFHANYGSGDTPTLHFGLPPLLPLLSQISPLQEKEEGNTSVDMSFADLSLRVSSPSRCSSYSAMVCARALQRLFEMKAGSSGVSALKLSEPVLPNTSVTNESQVGESNKVLISSNARPLSQKQEIKGVISSISAGRGSSSYDEMLLSPPTNNSGDKVDDIDRCLDAIFSNPIGDTPVPKLKDYSQSGKDSLSTDRISSVHSSSAVLHHAPLFQSRRRSFWSRQEVLLASREEETRVSAYLLGTNLYPPASGFY